MSSNVVSAPIQSSSLNLSLGVSIGRNQIQKAVGSYKGNYQSLAVDRIANTKITLGAGESWKSNANETTKALVLSTSGPVAVRAVVNTDTVVVLAVESLLVLDMDLASYKITNEGTESVAIDMHTVNVNVPVEVGVSYYGAAALPVSVDEAFILTLTDDGTGKATLFTVDASTNLYIWYAYPTNEGSAEFTVNGFTGGFTLVSTSVDVDGIYYTVYRSDNEGLGVTDVAVS